MPIQLIRQDITKMKVDAIVSPANPELRAGSGLNGLIHKVGGAELTEACKKLNGCKTGEAKITPAFALPCKHVIHTVGPVWHGGDDGEPMLLASCYRNALELATKHGCNTIAFPLISSGAYGYPKDKAMKVAINAISSFLFENDFDEDPLVYIVAYNKEAVAAGKKVFSKMDEYIDDRYVEQHSNARRRYMEDEYRIREYSQANISLHTDRFVRADTLSAALRQKPETFSETVLRLIQEKGMTNAQCYKKANVDKNLFSKIKLNPHYKPEKKTALALAIALELSLKDTNILLAKAGLTLSPCNKEDIIVEYFIKKKHYDIFDINEALFDYGFENCLLGNSIY